MVRTFALRRQCFTSVFFNGPLKLKEVILSTPPNNIQIDNKNVRSELPNSYLRGVVKDSGGKLLPSASIRIEEFPELFVETTSNGDFFLDGIPKKEGDKVRLFVSKDGYDEHNEFVALPGPVRITLTRSK